MHGSDLLQMWEEMVSLLHTSAHVDAMQHSQNRVQVSFSVSLLFPCY